MRTTYVRHCLERTLLYRLVEECFPALKAHLAAQGTALPGYVEQEFAVYAARTLHNMGGAR
jgi:hypothetical protein